MAGIKDPIKFTQAQKENALKLEALIEDLLFELDRAAKAGLEEPLEINKRRQEVMKTRRILQAMKKEYI